MGTSGRARVRVGDVVTALEQRYPPAWAEQWDRVGLVLGEPTAEVRRVSCVVDCVPETVAEALDAGADMIVAHHPLLLRGVSSVAPTTYKGRIVHQLIKNDVALYVAHTNADVANPGVSDALAGRLGLTGLRPLSPPEPGSPAATAADPAQAAAGADAATDPARGAAVADPAQAAAAESPGGAGATTGRGIGRIGTLPRPMPLAELVRHVAAALPATAWGVRAAGDPARTITRLAVCGGSGDFLLARAVAAGVDAFLTADLRHHPVSEHLAEGGPALIDAAHWATERPWLDDLAGYLRERLGLTVSVSDLDTDPWTLHAPSGPSPTPPDPAP